MKLRITVENRAYEVDVEILEEGNGHYHVPSAVPAPITAPTASNAAVDTASAVPRPVPAKPVSSSGSSSDRIVKAPISGTVLAVNVAVGDSVELTQVLMVVEAMKMETNIASPIVGRIKKIHVRPGDAVKTGQLLVEFE